MVCGHGKNQDYVGRTNDYLVQKIKFWFQYHYVAKHLHTMIFLFIPKSHLWLEDRKSFGLLP